MRLFVLLILAAMLTGCAHAREARLNDAKEAYQSCLKAAHSNIDTCELEKTLFDSEVSVFNATNKRAVAFLRLN